MYVLMIYQNPDAADNNAKNAFPTGEVIGIGSSVVLVAGTAAYFLIRHISDDLRHKREVIAAVEGSFEQGRQQYAAHAYDTAQKQFELAFNKWDEYVRYCKPQERPAGLGRDSLNADILNCKLLFLLKPQISQIQVAADDLPALKKIWLLAIVMRFKIFSVIIEKKSPRWK